MNRDDVAAASCCCLTRLEQEEAGLQTAETPRQRRNHLHAGLPTRRNGRSRVRFSAELDLPLSSLSVCTLKCPLITEIQR